MFLKDCFEFSKMEIVLTKVSFYLDGNWFDYVCLTLLFFMILIHINWMMQVTPCYSSTLFFIVRFLSQLLV